MLSNFTILILTHFISDYYFQPDKWGANKIKIFKYRFLHCIQYSIIFLPVLFFLKINLLWTLWLFIAHLLIDDYKFVNWWNKNIKRVSGELPPTIPAVQDQILHILCLIPLVSA